MVVVAAAAVAGLGASVPVGTGKTVVEVAEDEEEHEPSLTPTLDTLLGFKEATSPPDSISSTFLFLTSILAEHVSSE